MTWEWKEQGTHSLVLPSSSTVTSGHFTVRGSVDTTIQISFMSGVTGTFWIQISQDTTYWADLEDSNKAVLSTDTVKIYNIQQRPSVKYLRIKYVASSGTSVATIRCDIIGTL